MSDFVDKMYHVESSKVKSNSNSLNQTLDKVRGRARSGKLTEKFPDESDTIPVKKRPGYLACAIAQSLKQIRFYKRVCRQLEGASHTRRRSAESTQTQPD